MNGSLEILPESQLLRYAPGLSRLTGAHAARKAALAKAREALRKSTVGGAAAGAAKGFVATLASETATEGAQKAVSMGAEERAKAGSRVGVPPSAWGDLAPRTGAEYWGEVWSEMGEAARSMWMLSLLGPSIDLPGEISSARRTARNTRYLELLGQSARASKLAQRAPEALREAVQKIKQNGPVEQVFVSVDAWDGYWRAQQQDPSAVAELVLGNRQAYEAARQAGGDLVIPLEDYTSRIATTQHHDGLAADIRLRQGDRSLREQVGRGQELSAEIRGQVEAFAAESPDGYDPDRRSVYDAVVALATGAGRSEVEADADARLWAGFFGVLAQRFNDAGTPTTARALFERYNITATAEKAAVSDEAAVLAGERPTVLDQPPLPRPNVTQRPEFLAWSKGYPVAEGDAGLNIPRPSTPEEVALWDEFVGLAGEEMDAERGYVEAAAQDDLLTDSMTAKIEQIEALSKDQAAFDKANQEIAERGLDPLSPEAGRIYQRSGLFTRAFNDGTLAWVQSPSEMIALVEEQMRALDRQRGSSKAKRDEKKKALDAARRSVQEFRKRNPSYGQRFVTGEPVVVRAFHGSASGTLHNTFDPAYLGGNTGAPSATLGWFFSGKTETAQSYTADGSDWSATDEELNQTKADLSEWYREVEHYVAGLLKKHNDTLWHYLSPHNMYRKYGPFRKDGSGLARQGSEYINIWAMSRKLWQGQVQPDIDKIFTLFQAIKMVHREEGAALDAFMDRVEALSQKLDNNQAPQAVYDVFLRLENPFVYDYKGSAYREKSYYDVIKKARDAGHDSVILTNTVDGGPVDNIFVVLKGYEHQIKATTAEVFSESTDIYEQGGVDWKDSSAYLPNGAGRGAAVTLFSSRSARESASPVTPQVAEELQAAGIPIREDGTLNAAEIVLHQTRNWREWTDKFAKNRRVKQVYDKDQIAEFARAIERLVAHFGDFSLLPEEFEDQSPIRENDDKLFGFTIDLTTVCPRQDLYIKVIAEIERGIGEILNPYDRHLVGAMLREYGLKPACWYCYGQAGRNRFDEVLKTAPPRAWAYAELLRANATEDEIYAGLGWRKNTKGRWTRQGTKGSLDPKGALLRFIREHLDGLDASMFEPLRIRDILQRKAEPRSQLEADLAEAVGGFAQAASLRNAPKPWASVRDQILRISDEKIAQLNRGPGVRMNSQTDFRPWHAVELVEMLLHLSAKRAAAHAYTKEADFVRAFGRTGIKFNLSAAYRVDQVTKKLVRDAEGRPVFDAVAGMDGAAIEELIAKFPRDARGMLVGMNDEQIWAALDDARIGQIIPYHAGAVPKVVDAFEGAQNYSSSQDEIWPEGKTRAEVTLKDGRTFTLTPDTPLTREHHLGKKSVYLEICQQAGIEPRFAKFVSHKNYMKLVHDVAAHPDNHHIVDPSRIDYDALSEMIDRWMEKGGDLPGAQVPPEILSDIIRRFRTGDLPQSMPGQLPDPESVLNQNEKREPRGEIRIRRAQRKFAINLFQNADPSTFAHESSHAFLEILFDLSRRKDAPQSLRDDVARILEYLGVQKIQQVKREQHETFARTVEAVLFEGDAPAPGLDSVFARFRAWLTQVYGSVANLNVEPTPEIRRVIRGLFATEQEIAQAEGEQGYQVLFGSAAEAGMSDAEYAAYQARAAQAREEGRSRLARRIAMQTKRERDEDYRREREQVETEVREEMEKDPVYRALSWLQRGQMPEGVAPPPLLTDADGRPIRLDKATLLAEYGEEAVRGLPSPRNKRGAYIYQTRDGVHPDVAARAFGLESGAALIAGLQRAPNLQDARISGIARVSRTRSG